MYCKIKVDINNNQFETNVIIDTGNFLREPITRAPVIVIEKQELSNIIPHYILENLDNIVMGQDVELDEYSSRIRIIPFTSLGKENGILLGLKADNVIVKLEENSIKISNAIIAIYNGILNKTGKYHGLIGLDIVDEKTTDNLSYQEIL